jgi:hypothetical protein
MAGKNQHYIPQLLLREFASQRKGRRTFVWYFKKATPPKQEDTQNIGYSTDNKALRQRIKEEVRSRGGVENLLLEELLVRRIVQGVHSTQGEQFA